jgi:hypothetical protein
VESDLAFLSGRAPTILTSPIPFAIIYDDAANAIHILAVAHSVGVPAIGAVASDRRS